MIPRPWLDDEIKVRVFSIKQQMQHIVRLCRLHRIAPPSAIARYVGPDGVVGLADGAP